LLTLAKGVRHCFCSVQTIWCLSAVVSTGGCLLPVHCQFSAEPVILYLFHMLCMVDSGTSYAWWASAMDLLPSRQLIIWFFVWEGIWQWVVFGFFMESSCTSYSSSNSIYKLACGAGEVHRLHNLLRLLTVMCRAWACQISQLESHSTLVSPTYSSWIPLYSTGIYLCVNFFIFIYYILGTFQVIPGHSSWF